MRQIRRLRELKGITQEQLAHLAGVSLRTIVRAETSGDVTVGTVRRIAAALGVTPSALLDSGEAA